MVHLHLINFLMVGREWPASEACSHELHEEGEGFHTAFFYITACNVHDIVFILHVVLY